MLCLPVLSPDFPCSLAFSVPGLTGTPFFSALRPLGASLQFPQGCQSGPAEACSQDPQVAVLPPGWAWMSCLGPCGQDGETRSLPCLNFLLCPHRGRILWQELQGMPGF